MLTDAVLVTIYAGLAVLIVGTTISSLMHSVHENLSKAYLGISVCLLGWLFVTCLHHITTAPGMAEYTDNLTFAFIAFMPVILLVFTLWFYRERQGIDIKTILLVSIIPTITTIISAVPSFNWLLRTNYEILQMYPLHVANYTWNIWFYVHHIYSYLLMVLAGVFILRQLRTQPTEYRVPSILLIVGISIIFLSDIPSLNSRTDILDYTLIGVCLSVEIIYFAVVNNPAVEFLSSARKTLYNNLDIPVFILDKQDCVLDLNRAAQQMLEKLEHPQKSLPFDFQEVIRAISNEGGVLKSGYIGDDVAHILISMNGEKVVLRQVRREIISRKSRHLGSYVAMMDVTQISRIIDDLKYESEMDPLTGIPNRRAYEKKISEWDVPENLPISFIVGDVNRLKLVNDTIGHRQGDMLLKMVADTLMEACPKDGFCARIGGDEFIMILPGCDREQAQEIADDIQRSLEVSGEQCLDASIALGCVSKTRPEQDVANLLHCADRLMYAQKEYDPRKRSG